MLRAAARAVAIEVAFGAWLYMMTILLSLFVALSKRGHELVLLAQGPPQGIARFSRITPYLLDQIRW